jgi:AraC-like DNA-binding protein
METLPASSPACSQQLDGFSWAKTCVALGATSVAPLRHDYYESDVESLSGDGKLDIVGRMGMSSPYQVSLFSSRRRYAFWRNWRHINDNKVNIVMMRYVKSGAFSLTQCGTTMTIGAGQFCFSKSTVPFRWESLSDDMRLSEYYSILLPLDAVHRHFPEGMPMKNCLSAQSTDRRLAMPSLFSLLTDQGQYLEPTVAKMLVDALLQEALEVSTQTHAEINTRKHICDKRTEDILAYISLQLANPDITALSVARACAISPRYLCYLLKLKGTTFSELLWEERLKKTKEWLLALDTRHFTIGEIAYMNGFKTAAHFSRLFKDYWGCSPREYRKSGGKSAPVAIEKPLGHALRLAEADPSEAMDDEFASLSIEELQPVTA